MQPYIKIVKSTFTCIENLILSQNIQSRVKLVVKYKVYIDDENIGLYTKTVQHKPFLLMCMQFVILHNILNIC